MFISSLSLSSCCQVKSKDALNSKFLGTRNKLLSSGLSHRQTAALMCWNNVVDNMVPRCHLILSFIYGVRHRYWLCSLTVGVRIRVVDATSLALKRLLATKSGAAFVASYHAKCRSETLTEFLHPFKQDAKKKVQIRTIITTPVWSDTSTAAESVIIVK